MAIAQIDPALGDLTANMDKHREAIARAKEEGVAREVRTRSGVALLHTLGVEVSRTHLSNSFKVVWRPVAP